MERGVIERQDKTSLENVGGAVEIRSDGGDRTRWERETAVTAWLVKQVSEYMQSSK